MPTKITEVTERIPVDGTYDKTTKVSGTKKTVEREYTYNLETGQPLTVKTYETREIKQYGAPDPSATDIPRHMSEETTYIY